MRKCNFLLIAVIAGIVSMCGKSTTDIYQTIAGPTTVSGRVNAVDATVTITQGQTVLTTQTDKNGYFTIANVELGNAHIKIISKNGSFFVATFTCTGNIYDFGDVMLYGTPYPITNINTYQNSTDLFYITFAEPMDSVSTEAAISFSPDVKGYFTWSNGNKNVMFSMANPENQVITVFIDSTAKTLFGDHVANKDTLKINSVENSQPIHLMATPSIGSTNINVSSQVYLYIADTLPQIPDSSFLVTPKSELNVVRENSYIYITPKFGTWNYNTTYTISIADSIRDSANRVVISPQKLTSFTTILPGIANVYPSQNSMYSDTSAIIAIYFNVPMDTAKTLKSFLLADSLGAVLGTGSWDTYNAILYFKPTKTLTANDIFTVSIDTSARTSQQSQIKPFTSIFGTFQQYDIYDAPISVN
jgi:hypothetical protein